MNTAPALPGLFVVDRMALQNRDFRFPIVGAYLQRGGRMKRFAFFAVMTPANRASAGRVDADG
jgi:hypothetical protein